VGCLVIGAGALGLYVRSRSHAVPSTVSAPADGLPAAIEGLDRHVDKNGLAADVREILDPATPLERRREIYLGWLRLRTPDIEPLVWQLAPVERNPKARMHLYMAIPRGPVREPATLMKLAREEWDAGELEPLLWLIALLEFHPTPETEQFFVEVLKARPRLRADWIGERFMSVQRAFPRPGAVSSLVADAMSDRDELVRGYAALARATVGDHAGVECAIRGLDSESSGVRKLAIVTIERHGDTADAARLVKLLDDPDAGVRKAALEVLTDRKIPLDSDP
jgi:hypothetical protein